ncbi:MAG: hypothetical protein V3U06_02590, partial [Candidatus Binatia bacterium]
MERMEGANPIGTFWQVGKQLKRIVGPVDFVNSLPLVCSLLVLSFVVGLLLFVLYMTFVPGLPTEPG